MQNFGLIALQYAVHSSIMFREFFKGYNIFILKYNHKNFMFYVNTVTKECNYIMQTSDVTS